MENKYFNQIDDKDLINIRGGEIAFFKDAGFFVGKALHKFFDHMAYCAMNYNLGSAAK